MKIKFLSWTGKPEIELADLCGASLCGANLCGADLRRVDLRRVNLYGADLSEADLCDANLSGANLYEANLCGADLRRVDLRRVNLYGADLSEADLCGASLCGANLCGANLPSPQIILSAHWGELSNDLTADLMEYDASSHPDRTAFDRWAKGGPCPFVHAGVQRAANFNEKKELWGKGKQDTPYNLMMRVFTESGIKR